MKRFFCIFLTAIALLLCSCEVLTGIPEETAPHSQIVYGSDSPDTSPTEGHDENVTVKITSYSSWEGFGYKNITGAYAKLLADAISSLTETDEREAELGDESLELDDDNLPIDDGTLWIEIGDACYRYSHGKDLCRVERRLGEGVILSTTEEVQTLISNARNYWPYNYFYCQYSDGKLTLEQRFEIESPVKVTVKDLYVEKSDENESYIVFELLSPEDTTVSGYYLSGTGGCVIYDEGFFKADLTAGETRTLKISYLGTYEPYLLEINTDTYSFCIRIDP